MEVSEYPCFQDCFLDLGDGFVTGLVPALELDAKYRWQIPAEMTIHNMWGGGVVCVIRGQGYTASN